MEISIQAAIATANAQERFLSPTELQAVSSLFERAIASLEAAQSLTNNAQQLIEGAAQVVYNYFPDYPSIPINQTQCDQNLSFYLRIVTYCLLCGNTEPINKYLISSLADMNSPLNLSPDCAIQALNYIQANHGLIGEAAIAANTYINYAIKALKEYRIHENTVHQTPKKPQNVPSSEILSLEEIKSRYPNEWVLIAYTERDNTLNIIRGEVLGHSPDCEDIDNQLAFCQEKAVAIEYTGPIAEEFGILM